MKFIRTIIAEKASTIDDDPDVGTEVETDAETDVEADLRQAFATMHPADTDDEVDGDDGEDEVEVEVEDVEDVAGQGDLLAQTNSASETNSEPVMRTIYHPGPPLSEAAVAKLDLAKVGSAQDVDRNVKKARQEAARKSIQQQMGQERPSSTFQKIMQRETALPQRENALPGQIPQAPTPVARSAPTKPRPDQAAPTRKKAGRVKTRLLGFGNDFGGEPDLFASGETAAPAPQIKFPVGWMVVVSGPGRGTAFTLFDGVSQIGRGEDQAVRLDFGDTSISRSNHAAIAYDPEQQSFYLGHGGKANLVRLNGNPVLSTEPLADGAEIRLGETTLRFVGLCGPAFDWGKSANDDGAHEAGIEGGNGQFD